MPCRRRGVLVIMPIFSFRAMGDGEELIKFRGRLALLEKWA